MHKHIYILLGLLSFIDVFGQFQSIQPYSIETRSTGRYLNANTSANSKFVYNRAKSEWHILDNGDETFRIVNIASNEVLAVKNASLLADEKVLTEPWSTQEHQKWILIKTDGFYRILNVKSGLALSAIDEVPAVIDPNPDVAYYNFYSSVGAGVQQSYVAKEAQQFHIAPIKDSYQEALVVPQLGWKPHHKKEALLISNTELGAPTFNVVDAHSQTSVLTGTMTKWTATSTWGQYYYVADVSGLSTEGHYQIQANGLVTNMLIGNDIYFEIKYNKGGTLRYSDFFNGFWKYNHFYPETQTINEATVFDNNGTEEFTVTGTYDVPPYGWFDAHSRDSKMGRTAKAIADMCLGHFHTTNLDDKLALEDEIKYGLEHIFRTHNKDGSWPAGRIRETTPPRIYYYWVTNVDAYNSARIAKALALAYQVFKDSEPDIAAEALSTAELAWDFVINNELLVDENIGKSFKGQSVDLLGAAVEMAYATGETKYFNKADEMFNAAKFKNGIFTKEDGTKWPSETGNTYAELDNGSIPSLCRYYNIARTQGMRERVTWVMETFLDFWSAKPMSPFGFPQHPIDRTTDFGNTIQVARLAYNMLGYADYLNNEKAFEIALAAFNHLTGYNPYATSYIVGLGDETITPSVNFFKRSYEDGLGAILPGFTNDGTSFIQSFEKYQTGESVVPISSTLFYMLSRFNSYSDIVSEPEAPLDGDLKINEVNSHATPNASFVEIYNTSNKTISLENIYLEHYNTSASYPGYNGRKLMSGTIEPYGYVIVTRDLTDFEDAHGISADFSHGGIHLNTNTIGLVLRHGSLGTLDQFSDVTTSTTAFGDDHLYVRNGYNNDGTDLSIHWIDKGTQQSGTPKAYNGDISLSIPHTDNSLEVRAYPNPFSHSFSIATTYDLGNVEIIVRSLSGKLIKHLKQVSPQGLQLGTDLSAGVYLVEVVHKDYRKIMKVVKR
ncbi:glycoside hydrolase family 9 protein [Carboxylicivirga marina]|uniref:glycoside hydrolase family 9 protein n=1 Tax=Carboxylicivirga marina TaxID=2800988 RepID=UPI002597BF2F|nr:glycoside hydrolase family 9 protein [uncultured Carboxylicivirga sp.]